MEKELPESIIRTCVQFKYVSAQIDSCMYVLFDKRVRYDMYYY